MEVEVKLRLPSAAVHQALSDALRPFHVRTHLQENLFFDGPGGDLALAHSALRLRFYDSDSRCVISLKSRASLSAGVSRVEETEEDLDPHSARLCVSDPSRLLSLPSPLVRRLSRDFPSLDRLVCLGGFRNVRAVHAWLHGLTLELDETRYDFGTSYELECETKEPERARELLETFLREKGIPYDYSQASKFASFRAGRLL